MKARRDLNRVLNGLNQNRSLQRGPYPVEMNRNSLPVSCGATAGFKTNLNLCVNEVSGAKARGAFAASGMTDRA